MAKFEQIVTQQAKTSSVTPKKIQQHQVWKESRALGICFQDWGVEGLRRVSAQPLLSWFSARNRKEACLAPSLLIAEHLGLGFSQSEH